jgi:Protein of unknown function (DUF3307)
MQQSIQIFLALYLAHLLTDFVFQSSRLVAKKRQGAAAAYLWHGVIHAVSALVLVALVWPAGLRSWPSYALILSLVLVHLLIDHIKLALVSSHKVVDGLGAFTVDQVVHALTVFAAALAMARVSPGEVFGRLASMQFDREKLLWVVVVYVGIIWSGGYLLRYVTKPLIKRGLPEIQEGIDELENAGLYIGWLERFLVLTAMLLRSPATVGLILTAKSIARYPEFRSFRFAEYFLIGTLLSISLGMLGGIFLMHVLHKPLVLLAP